MEKFKDTIITNAGRTLLLDVGSGDGMITYTKAVLFDQDVKDMQDEDIRKLTSLTGDEIETTVAATPPTDNTVTVSATFDNGKLTKDINFNSIGWFAKSSVDNKEILLGVTPTNTTQTLAAGSPDHRSTASIRIELAMALSNAAKVDLTVNEAGIAHIEDVDSAIEKLKTEMLPKIDAAGKVKGAKIHSQLSIDDDSSDDITYDSGVLSPDDSGIINISPDGVAGHYSNLLYELVQVYVSMAVTDQAGDSDSDELKGTQNLLDKLAENNDGIANLEQAAQGFVNTFITQDTLSQYIQSLSNEVDQNNNQFQQQLEEIATEVRQFAGSNTIDSPDFDTLTDTGVFYITENHYASTRNAPNAQEGILLVYCADDKCVAQIFISGIGNTIYERIYHGSSWGSWQQVAFKSDISSLQNQVTDLTNQLKQQKDTVNTITVKLGNGDLGVLKNFSQSQLSDALDFSKDKGDNVTRIGIVSDDGK